jgi:hypothetical protein
MSEWGSHVNQLDNPATIRPARGPRRSRPTLEASLFPDFASE